MLCKKGKEAYDSQIFCNIQAPLKYGCSIPAVNFKKRKHFGLPELTVQLKFNFKKKERLILFLCWTRRSLLWGRTFKNVTFFLLLLPACSPWFPLRLNLKGGCGHSPLSSNPQVCLFAFSFLGTCSSVESRGPHTSLAQERSSGKFWLNVALLAWTCKVPEEATHSCQLPLHLPPPSSFSTSLFLLLLLRWGRGRPTMLPRLI